MPVLRHRVLVIVFVAQLVFLLGHSPTLAQAVCPHDDSTLIAWSVWPGAAATTNGGVFLSVADRVLLDVSLSLTSIDIDGVLVFANGVDLTVNVSWIRVNSIGSLIAGSSEDGCQITSKVKNRKQSNKAQFAIGLP